MNLPRRAWILVLCLVSFSNQAWASGDPPEFVLQWAWGAMSMKVFDFNNDGRMDLYVTDMHSDMSQQIGPDDEKLKADIQYPLVSLNNGGFENSIYGNALFLAEGEERFQEVSDEVGAENYWPWGFSVGDLNADGYDDVFIASSMNYPWRYGINSVLLNDRGVRFVDRLLGQR